VGFVGLRDLKEALLSKHRDILIARGFVYFGRKPICSSLLTQVVARNADYVYIHIFITIICLVVDT